MACVQESFFWAHSDGFSGVSKPWASHEKAQRWSHSGGAIMGRGIQRCHSGLERSLFIGFQLYLPCFSWSLHELLLSAHTSSPEWRCDFFVVSFLGFLPCVPHSKARRIIILHRLSMGDLLGRQRMPASHSAVRNTAARHFRESWTLLEADVSLGSLLPQSGPIDRISGNHFLCSSIRNNSLAIKVLL